MELSARASVLAIAVLSACVNVPEPEPEPTPWPELCGDGVRQYWEQCDEGPANGATECGCQADCRIALPSQACDDGLLCTVGDSCDGVGGCAPGVPEDCYDADPCTLDRCDPASDSCTWTTWSGAPLERFDLGVLGDESSLGVETLSSSTAEVEGQVVRVDALRYRAPIRRGCREEPSYLHGHLAWPLAAERAGATLPALIWAPDLGGASDRLWAASLAATFGAVVHTFDPPGHGDSLGPDVDEHWIFDASPDPRNHWFWSQTVAVLRAVTLLEATPLADPAHIVVSAQGASGAAAWFAAAADPRIHHLIVNNAGAGWGEGPGPQSAMAPWFGSITPDEREAAWSGFLDHDDPAVLTAEMAPSAVLILGLDQGQFPLAGAAATAPWTPALSIVPGGGGPLAGTAEGRLDPVTEAEIQAALVGTSADGTTFALGPGCDCDASPGCGCVGIDGPSTPTPELWWTLDGGEAWEHADALWDGAAWSVTVPGGEPGAVPGSAAFVRWVDAASGLARTSPLRLAPGFPAWPE